MPLRDLPPWYPLDPELRDVSARFKDGAQDYIEQAICYCKENASRDDPNDALSVGSDMVAVQLNVLAHQLRETVAKLAPSNARALTHDYLLQQVVENALQRALKAHMERNRDA
jgi:hypothetical protein